MTRKRKDLNGEIVLVTGAASGLGKNVVLRLAKLFPGAVFVLWDINKNGLIETKEECLQVGVTDVHVFVVNLADRKDVSRVATLVRQQVGTVTVLFNNAGMSLWSPLVNADPVKEEMVIRINLLSYMWTTREFLPGMIQNGKGHLINTSSGLGFYRFPNLSSYVASKYGLRGFLDSLRLEMKRHPGQPDITISIIYPPWVKTPMTEGITWEPRYGWKMMSPLDADDVAEEMVDGILKEKREIIIPRLYKIGDIMYRILPSDLVDTLEEYLQQNFRVVEPQYGTVQKSLTD